jgi:hypothetical protein
MGDHEEEQAFAMIKLVVTSDQWPDFFKENDRRLLRAAMSFSDEKVAKRYCLQHVNEFSPAVRESFIDAFVEELETEIETREIKAEYEAAWDDIKRLHQAIGHEKMTHSTPSLIQGFLKKKWSRDYPLEMIRAVLRDQGIPVLLEKT